MRRLPASALLIAGLALPMFAQRSASRGGFSGHSAPAFHMGSTASVPYGFTGGPRYTSSRPIGMAPGFRGSGRGNYNGRPTYSGVSPYRRRYLSPYRARIGYPFLPWIGWGGLGYPGYPDDTIGYDNSAAPAGYAAPYESQPFDEGPPPPAYQVPVQQSHPSSAPESEEATTLVFKDGRPPEQIHNYILTHTTLYVRDQHHRDIPVDQLDIAATQRVNHDAGVDFQLPEAPR
jgi:hypothetical protein